VTSSVLLLLLGGGGLIGVLLAVLGAGGSILLLPLLVGGAALSTREAVPLSLLVVTLLALGNLGPYMKRRQVAPKPALVLGLPALAGSWIGGSWVKAGFVSETVQLGLFAAAALLASWLLSRRSAMGAAAEQGRSGLPLALAVQGLLVGLLTGSAGVGGGFAIVPVLVLLAGLPMPLASGTSLLLIAVNSLVALAALGHWPAARLPLMLPLVTGGFGRCLGRPAPGPPPARSPTAPRLCRPAGRLGPAQRRRSLAPPGAHQAHTPLGSQPAPGTQPTHRLFAAHVDPSPPLSHDSFLPA